MGHTDRDVSTLNQGYAEELHEQFLSRPASVDADTRAFFARSHHVSPQARKLVALVRLAGAIRTYGHRSARLNPLSSGPPRKDATIDPATYRLDPAELVALPAHAVGGPGASSSSDAAHAIERLRAIYCGSRGYDYAHIHDPKEHRWLLEAAEAGRFRPPSDPVDPARLLESLSRVEAFETFVHRMLPGKFRFSVEGLDVLVPMLQEILGEAAERGVRSLLLGMAHRGRLNVLAHVLNMPYARILSELRDPKSARGAIGDASGFRGDVTYHMGARRQATYTDGETARLLVTIPPNPSHVEAIDPVVLGMARAAGSDCSAGGAPRLSPGRTLPILVHGDASFPGQGVVAETLNLGRLPAYHVGGTIHIIANNQIGFTTEPASLYGTAYASDLAKGFDAPVFHVNADDVEAAVEASRTAVAYLKRFQKDFVIDLIGYRRRGHNESDEPSFTQPLMDSRIDHHPTVRERYARELVGRGVVSEEERDAMRKSANEDLQAAWAENDGSGRGEERPDEGAAAPSKPRRSPPGSKAADIGVSMERLSAMNRTLLELPERFSLHEKLKRARRAKLESFERPHETTLDWAAAEELALASILADGVAIRFTGEDVERGTFSQRHAVLHDTETGERYVPLQALEGARASFEIENSPLTENAALAFEVGYSLEVPDRLVLWEAQYGDFVNGAQTVIDELIVSARTKWGVSASLCLLLPHGHEGHGPDHSSARPERFLALAAEDNLRIASPTTPAQYFHLLRSHAALLGERARPLIVFSPKALLRHPLATSAVRELASGAFRPLLDDVPTTAQRLLLTSGKLGVEVTSATRQLGEETIGLARVEELYPFPAERLRETIQSIPGVREVVWLQEEPRNMGAWDFVRPRLAPLLPDDVPLRCIARPPSSSPAEGSSSEHRERQDALVDRALDLSAASADVEETSHAR